MTDPGIRVLHVDDDAQQTTLTARVLEDVADDVSVVTETSAPAALDRLGDERVDCVVSDYDMPRMDGLELLEAVRDDYPDLPFVLFTGKGSEEIASRAISAGVTDYLQKGGGTDTYRILANRIANAVDKWRAERETRKVYRAMETAREGIGLLDENGRFTYVNEAYADLYGYEPAEMLGEHWEILYPEGERDRVHEEILPAVSEHETWRGETTGLRSDGSTFVEDHSLAEREDGGLVCAIRDASDQGVDERDRPSLTSEVLDTSDVGTIVVDADGAVSWLNRAVEEYFGLDRADVLGADHERAVREHVQEVMAAPERFAELTTADRAADRFECRVRDTDDTDERWLERWTQPIESGHYAGGRIIHHKDVTERKRHEEELERSRRELQHQNERLEEFASVLSHDLRNPLSIAQTYAAILDERDADGEVVEEIRRALDRMDTIIEDVLTLAREGESVEDTSRVELRTVAEQTWANVHADDAALRAADGYLVEADEVRLKRLLENLFQNALEHGYEAAGAPGSAGLTVEVGVLDDESGFYVADDGPGIPAEERDRVFESGFSTAEEGTGFGLSIVRQIARAHGWSVEVTDSDAGGARFELTGADVSTRTGSSAAGSAESNP